MADAVQSFRRAVAVTPSDDDSLSTATGLYIGVSGDVIVQLRSGDPVTFKGHPVGYLWAPVTKVLATGTTATDILALY